jgi:hypothetical protein
VFSINFLSPSIIIIKRNIDKGHPYQIPLDERKKEDIDLFIRGKKGSRVYTPHYPIEDGQVHPHLIGSSLIKTQLTLS